jgi:Flp pilus assembly protein TadD
MEKYQEAIEAYQRALSLDPRNPQVHYELGLSYLRVGDFESLEKELEFLEELDPEKARALREEMGK